MSEPTTARAGSEDDARGPGRRKPRPSPGSRRFGYLVAVAVNLVILMLVNVRPTWRAWGFLTEDATVVVAWFAVSLVVGVVVNLVWMVHDPLWLRSLGDAVSAAVGVVVLGHAVTVFPFAVEPGSGLESILRVGLWVALVLTAIAVVVNLVMVVVNAARGEPPSVATPESDAS